MGESGLAAEPPLTIHQVLASAVERFGDYTALSWKDGEQRKSLSYREYYQACRTAAKSFLKVSALLPSSVFHEEERVVQILCLSAAGIGALPWRRNPGLQLGRVVHRQHRHHFGRVSVCVRVRVHVRFSSHLWACCTNSGVLPHTHLAQQKRVDARR